MNYLRLGCANDGQRHHRGEDVGLGRTHMPMKRTNANPGPRTVISV